MPFEWTKAAVFRSKSRTNTAKATAEAVESEATKHTQKRRGKVFEKARDGLKTGHTSAQVREQR